MPAYVEVLAEDAAQIATAEKNCPRTTRPPQAILLANVREVAADPRMTATLTDRNLAGCPVNLAITRT